MLRLLLAATVAVLVAIALVGGSSAIPPVATQFAPPPTPRPDELSVVLSEEELSSRLGVPVRLIPNQLLVGAASGYVELRRGKPRVVLARGDVRQALQGLIDQEQARIGLVQVKSVTITEGRLLLIGSPRR